MELPEMNLPRRQLTDLICLSHLRWDFVFQRPQHLLSRWARHARVFYIEEPIFDGARERLEVTPRENELIVVVPHLPSGTATTDAVHAQRRLLDGLVEEEDIADFVLWFYTPMALPFSQHLRPSAVVYDCMDELSAFR